jgi:hypothetical protein
LPGGFSHLKPGAARKTHLLLSASLWTCIGCMLLVKGAYRLAGVEEGWFFLACGALIIGSLKSFAVLDRAAARTRDRILCFKEGTCLGAVYSLKTWTLVLCMAGMGVILRNSSLPIMLLCFIYLTVGWSLLLSSRIVWVAWLTHK